MNTSDETTGNENTAPNWWDTDTVRSATRGLRSTLASLPPHHEAVRMACIRLGLMAHIEGEGLFAGRALLGILRQLRKGRHPLWNTAPESSADCLIHFKLLCLLAEYPAASREEVEEMTALFGAAAREAGVSMAAERLARLAVAVRLGDFAAGDGLFPGLESDWRERQAEAAAEQDEDESESKEAQDEKVFPVCVAGMGQLLMEHLVFCNREPEALDLGGLLPRVKACEGPCETGPHAALGWMLEPLLKAGRESTAREFFNRSRSLAPVSARHLGAAGDRALFLARTGQPERAGVEIEAGIGLMQNRPDSSPWQQWRFCARSLQSLSLMPAASFSAYSADALQKRFEDLAEEFNRRNGNTRVADWWTAQFATEPARPLPGCA